VQAIVINQVLGNFLETSNIHYSSQHPAPPEKKKNNSSNDILERGEQWMKGLQA